MFAAFSAAHRGGSGPPLVLLHGFTDTWRTWELVLPALERRHDVLAPTLAGHAGGPPLPEGANEAALLEQVERAMDAAGFATAHLVGNSLGGYLALGLAARGRARSVVALAPAGGWARGDESYRDTLGVFAAMHEGLTKAAPHADALVATAAGRRSVGRDFAVRAEDIPPALLAHMVRGAAACPAVFDLIRSVLEHGYRVDAAAITCPVRIVWGSRDARLPWPRAAERFRTDWLPHADWVVLDEVGHCPQLDVPLETAQLILGHTAA